MPDNICSNCCYCSRNILYSLSHATYADFRQFWYYSKKYPNTKRQKVAIAVTLIGLIGSFTVTPWVFNSINTKSEQTQTTISSSSHSSDSSSFSSSKTSGSSTSEEKEKQEKERKEKELQEAQKQKQEQARKEAEAKQIAEAADQAVQQLENNPVQENISSAQAAVEHVADPATKASLTERIGQVQNAINQQAEEARQEAEKQVVEQQDTGSTGGYFKDARGRWHRPNGQYASKIAIANAGLAW